ncbi:MAG: hypothetical protein WC843_01410 [Candidatus Gracilibacteria bacterium]|jgi:glutathione synthase/RimK-type ligase-like ATP-grasp enzyme
MVFYVLHLPGVDPDRVRLLEKACQKLKVAFKALDPLSFDFSKPSPVKKGDLVYRVSRGKILQTFESYILQPGVVTFNQDPLLRFKDPFILLKDNDLSPKTIFCVTKDRAKLQKYVKALGGFPIVIKALGGSRGMGVMKVGSFSSLYGIVDFLLFQNKLLVLRQFIPTKASARFIVLGDKVIASLEYLKINKDFRTNESTSPRIKAKKYPKKMEELAIKATHLLDLEFGGVDVLESDGKFYVAEVNFPCNFVRAHQVLKQDVALEMVKFLKEKSERLNKRLN